MLLGVGSALVVVPLLGAPASVAASELSAAAAASSRPADCVAPSRSGNVWARARAPALSGYCNQLARGYTLLRESPERALAAATAATKLMPKRPEGVVLAARATVALGDPGAAFAQFRAAGVTGAPQLRSPGALHDFAVAAVGAGAIDMGIAAYRALVPRATLLDDPARRLRVYVEAAAWVMTSGPDALDEVVGYLTEARRRPEVPGYSEFILGTLALALDRRGDVAQARGVAAQAGGPWTLARWLDPDSAGVARLPVLPPGELHAMVAALAEASGSGLARDEWQAFVDVSPQSFFIEHARAKLRRRAGGRAR